MSLVKSQPLMVVLAALALAACGDETAAPTAGPPPVAPKKKVEAAPPPPAAAVEYAYNPINKRDPFRGLFVESSSSSASAAEEGEKVVCSEPLCQFDVDDLTVVAVVSGDANPMAMVEDKQGVGYVVRRNSKIGKQGGKVTQIQRDCIVVTSFIQGPDGKAQPNKVNMCVRPDQRMAPAMDLFQGKPYQ